MINPTQLIEDYQSERSSIRDSHDPDASDAGMASPELLAKMDAYWRAANYLSVGQIYPMD